MTSNPQDIGYVWEKQFAKRIGGTVQPGSGNQWYCKLDVKGNNFIWSLKATKHASFRVDTAMLKEAINAAEAPGGIGSDCVPGMAIRIAGEELVVLRVNDFIGLMSNDDRFISPGKAGKIKSTTSTPKLLRNYQED